METPPTIDYATPFPRRRRRPIIWIILALAAAIVVAVVSMRLLTSQRVAVSAQRAAAQASRAQFRAQANAAIQKAHASLREDEKIQRLLQAVERATQITFIRNGGSYSATEAAEHLRQKLRTAGRQDLTAREFIDEIAIKSTISGELYRIKFSDGREITANQWLSDELRRIEENVPATQSAR